MFRERLLVCAPDCDRMNGAAAVSVAVDLIKLRRENLRVVIMGWLCRVLPGQASVNARSCRRQEAEHEIRLS